MSFHDKTVCIADGYNIHGCSQRYLPQLATETDLERSTMLSGTIFTDRASLGSVKSCGLPPGVEAVVVLARHHACEQCGVPRLAKRPGQHKPDCGEKSPACLFRQVADRTFAAAAKKAWARPCRSGHL